MNILAQTMPAETANGFWIQLLPGIIGGVICGVIVLLLTFMVQWLRKRPNLQLEGKGNLARPLYTSSNSNTGLRTIKITAYILNIGGSGANAEKLYVEKVLKNNKSLEYFEQKEARLGIYAPGEHWKSRDKMKPPPIYIPAERMCYIEKIITLKDGEFAGGPWEVKFTISLKERTLFRTRRKFSFPIPKDRA